MVRPGDHAPARGPRAGPSVGGARTRDRDAAGGHPAPVESGAPPRPDLRRDLLRQGRMEPVGARLHGGLAGGRRRRLRPGRDGHFPRDRQLLGAPAAGEVPHRRRHGPVRRGFIRRLADRSRRVRHRHGARALPVRPHPHAVDRLRHRGRAAARRGRSGDRDEPRLAPGHLPGVLRAPGGMVRCARRPRARCAHRRRDGIPRRPPRMGPGAVEPSVDHRRGCSGRMRGRRQMVGALCARRTRRST